ncbi:AGE family epimerase/isomerase [Teichococcus aerofrigidensis]
MSSSQYQKNSTQSISLLGIVKSVDPDDWAFTLRCRSGDTYKLQVNVETSFSVVRNMDDLDLDRVQSPPNYDAANVAARIGKYIKTNTLIAVQGIEIKAEGTVWFHARTVTLMSSQEGEFVFESTHWWLTQIATFADEWLDDLFGDRRTYEWDDFAALYRTNLNILGQPLDDTIQECATLSRLIYGLSSCYLLTGGERYLLAAKAGVKYQRQTFRSLSHDGRYCFWHFGKRKRDRGAVMIMPSENPDDRGSIPLYEQIYALAGMCQYYRITQDWEVLEDVARTIRTFQDYYLDDPKFGYTGAGGYFSHIDYATRRPNADSLGNNKMRKNWNSIGDHIPAYLINLILALDPLPEGSKDRAMCEELLETCRSILDTTTNFILTKFPDPNSKFVNERFHANWDVDDKWGWQQNRGIVGHNFKIAWNMTRVANFYRAEAARLAAKRPSEAQALVDRALEFEKLALTLAKNMTDAGIDQLRGGCFDAVERSPAGGLPIDFAWGNTKDFWQQEQAILAYLIVYGTTKDPEHLALAREMMSFWNLYFLDHDNRGVFFRTTDAGVPVIQGNYSQKAAHAVAGYHSFELNYLAHVYLRVYARPHAKPRTLTGKAGFPVDDQNFCLYFQPDLSSGRRTLNVLPDFLPPNAVKVSRITIGGVPRASIDEDNFQIELDADELGLQIVVEFQPQSPGS